MFPHTTVLPGVYSRDAQGKLVLNVKTRLLGYDREQTCQAMEQLNGYYLNKIVDLTRQLAAQQKEINQLKHL